MRGPSPFPLPLPSPAPARGRELAYLWALPTTCVGLLFLPFAWVGGGAQAVDGVLELFGGGVDWFLRHGTLLPGGASAMTLGHVVLGRDEDALEWTRAHERVHVRQCERWGPLFLPAYLLASAVLAWRGRRAYRDNPFEREAYEREGVEDAMRGPHTPRVRRMW